MLTQLEKYVISYKNISGEVVCNIPDYYNLRIAPLASKFERYNFDNDRTVICPFHDDHDPSLGLMKHRHLKDVMVYHCLGCGSVGTVVRMHQRIESQYNNRELTDKEACLDLCRIFNIPEPDEGVFEEEDFEKRLGYKMHKIDRLQSRYTEKDYAKELLNIRKNGVDIDVVSMSCVRMIATQKGLYEV